MNPATLAKLAQIFVQLSTLNIVPKGYLTSIAAAAQVLTGAALLLSTLVSAASAGEIPDTITLQDAFGLVLLTNGASNTGIGRKVEVLTKAIESTQNSVEAGK